LAVEAFRRGWKHIKTYFMIGLPTETEADIDAIADLCGRVLDAGKCVDHRAMVRTGISTFIPKPFTPFQWSAQIDIEETRVRQQQLAGLFREIGRGIKFGRHAPEASYIEGLLCRSDRRAAPLLLSALRHGAGFETWEERLNFNAWRTAIEETGFDAAGALAARELDAPLPWDHIDAQVSKKALTAEWNKAVAGQYTADCRDGVCNQCGANLHAASACSEMQVRAAAGREAEEQIPIKAKPSSVQREGVFRVRFRVGREGMLRFISHLETAQTWVCALRRAGAALAYSQGFHAHPKVTFSSALPVGEESEAEWMDVVLVAPCSPEALLTALQKNLPPGLCAYEAREVELRARALMADQVGLEYALYSVEPFAAVNARITALQEQDEWPVARSVKSRGGGGPKPGRKIITLDVRPLVTVLQAAPCDEGTAIRFATAMHEKRFAKPKEIAELLGLDPLQTRVRKMKTLLQ
ncbi:MAG: TIGR03936 family radical SAM-associated protein, partial [Candidatus Hydrogenedentes bacterium]|nr:TIGR03936 family radical SAM-associated protein [Candidatus Hydrogenedentota bacterium]